MKGFCRVRLRLKYYILYLFVSGHQNWNKKKKLSSKIIIEKLLNGKYEKHLAQQNTVINIRTIENASRKLDFLLTTAVIILLKTLGSKVLYIGYTFFLGVSSIIILGTLNSCCHQLVHNSLRFASFGPVIISSSTENYTWAKSFMPDPEFQVNQHKLRLFQLFRFNSGD